MSGNQARSWYRPARHLPPRASCGEGAPAVLCHAPPAPTEIRGAQLSGGSPGGGRGGQGARAEPVWV